MKIFEMLELGQAIAYTIEGGQALHIHKFGRKGLYNYKLFGHLFDQDENRLLATAKTFGVNILVIEHKGTPKQHVDLFGKPLERIIEYVHLHN